MLLGFPSFVVAFLSIICLVIRHKWRNAAASNEEIMRLVVMASEETEIAELEASAEYSSIPMEKRYQCAVCYSPTTGRCSQCKSVRYCSGRCQIVHWRQGHKDECCPPIMTVPFNEESDFNGKVDVQNQFERYSNDFVNENKFNFSAEPLLAMDTDHKAQSITDVRRINVGSASFSPSTTFFSSLNATNDSSVDTSISESNTSGRLEGFSSDVIDSDMCGIKPKGNDAKLPISPVSESTACSTSSISCADEWKNVKSSNSDEIVQSRLKILKTKTVMHNDVGSMNFGNEGTTDKAASSKGLVMNSSGVGSFESLGSSRLSFADNDQQKESHLSGEKVEQFMPFSGSGYPELSTSGLHSVPSFKLANYACADALPSKIESIQSSSKKASRGFKKSMMKVVEQFRASKNTKFGLKGTERDIGEKYNCKALIPYELFVQLYTCDNVELYPFGLINCGNSCYANTVLQCLAFTQPLISYLLRGLHSKTCSKKDWCFLCEFECLILKAGSGESPLSPIGILSQIQRIGSNLAHGREEDAHEFLRYAVDTMQSICLRDAGIVGPSAEESTLVGLTFGGYLQSKIKCMKCLVRSEQLEWMMDLTVEIDGDIGTLEQALTQFTTSEILDGENKYKCNRCKCYVKAKKKLRILEAPNILTIVLKRFQSGNFGKLNKSVQFPEVLNLASYMSGTSDKCPMYSLYAVVVHLDIMTSAFSGHYVSYVKNFQGKWFRIDDSMVIPVDSERVLSEGAYMLLYARHTPRAPSLMRNTNVSSDGKIKRNLEAIPSSGKRTSRAGSKSMAPSMHSSIPHEKVGRYPYWMTPDGYTSNHILATDDWRFYPVRRNPIDSSSDNSSIFSSSDAGSYSTESTKDSASSEDISGYIFGSEPSWYMSLGVSSDSDA